MFLGALKGALRPCAPAARIARSRTVARTFYSSSKACNQAQEEQKSSGLSEVKGVIEDVVAAKKPRAVVDIPWKPFRTNQIIRPHHLLYNQRMKANVRRKRAKYKPIPPSTRVCRAKDVFHSLEISPLAFTMQPSVLRQFVSNMGMIQSRAKTQLTRKSQRMITRAIKRARFMGVIPNLSKPTPEAKVGVRKYKIGSLLKDGAKEAGPGETQYQY